MFKDVYKKLVFLCTVAESSLYVGFLSVMVLDV